MKKEKPVIIPGTKSYVIHATCGQPCSGQGRVTFTLETALGLHFTVSEFEARYPGHDIESIHIVSL